MEVAFFPVNDKKTDSTAAVKASFGEEFSVMLASLMPQAVPTEAFFRGQEPVSGKAAVEEGAFTGFTDAKGITAGALIETARLDGEVEIPVRSDLKINVPEEPVMDSRGEIAPRIQPLIQPNEDEASFQTISEEPGLYTAESFNYSAPALQPSCFEAGVKQREAAFTAAQEGAQEPVRVELPSEQVRPQALFERTQTPFTPEPSKGLENAQTPVHHTKELMAVEKTGEKEIDVSSSQPAIDSPDAELAASDQLNLLPGSNERTAEVMGGAVESGSTEDPDVAGMAISFSNGFEGDRNEQETTGEPDEQSIVIEPTSVKADGAVHGPSFGRHLEASTLDPLPAVLKSAPVVSEVRDTVEAGIRLSAEAGGGEVRMKLNPEALGEVRIKLDVTSGVVKAEITVESREVKAMIEADSAFLKDALSSHGLTLDKCVVEVAKNADLKVRNENAWSDSSGDERASGNRGQEKGSGNWHGRFQKERERAEDSGVDFFI